MTRPHPLTTMSERAWAKAWRAEQEFVNRLHARRGSWLPNVIEARGWGVLRWTSGRPDHAAMSGQAVAETFVVLRPDIDDPAVRDEVMATLRDDPPAMRIGGFDVRQHQLSAALPGALGLGAFSVVVSVLAGLSFWLIPLLLVLGLAAGGIGGSVIGGIVADRRRAEVLDDAERVRVVMGRRAPTSWIRLVESATDMETTLPRSSHDAGEPDLLAADAVRVALWEAAGLLRGLSDHDGIEVLADGVNRLVEAHRA